MKANRTTVATALALALVTSSIALASENLVQDNGAGSGAVVGTVTVTNNVGTLNVSFEANSPYLFVEAHAAAALSCDDIPQTKTGNPRVGHFEDRWASSGLPGSDEVNLTLHNSFPEGSEICVAAHAIVYDSAGGATPEDAFSNTAESAWAGSDEFPGRNWATHFRFSLETSRVVFVTSMTFTGNLVFHAASLGLGDFTGDGIGAGDAICNALAQDALLPGTYKAWLSSSSSADPESTFVQATDAYERTDGVQIASDWSDLVTPNLSAPINLDENQSSVSDTVWTATSPDGTYDGLGNCSNWSTTGVGNTRYGSALFTDSRWSGWNVSTCSTGRRLYCFQQ